MENCAKTRYDSAFEQLPTSTTQYPGSGGCVGSGLTTMRAYDRGFAEVTKTIGPDNTTTSYVPDLFGRITDIYEPNVEFLGSVDPFATAKITYQTPVNGPFQLVTTQQRVDSGLPDGALGTTPTYRTTWTLLDGLGRTAATISQADAANDPEKRIVSGLVQRDSVGLVERAYIPFFSPYQAKTTDLPGPELAKSYRVVHDAFGRPTEARQLDGTLASDVVYHALSKEIYDANDLAGSAHPLTLRMDGHGRMVAASQSTDAGGAAGASADVMTTIAAYLPTGEVTSMTRSHTAGADTYTRSMTYDSLGRMVFNSEPNTSGKGKGGWTYAYDISGQIVGTSDARGCGVNMAYDGMGRVLSEDYSPCLNSQPTYTKPDNATGDGTEAWFHYDSEEAGQTTGLGANPIILKGKLAAVSDRGEHSRYGFDTRGRLAVVAKQLAVPGAADISTLGSRYAPTWYQTSTGYDEANRVTIQSTGAEVAGLLGTQGVGGASSNVTITYDDRDIPVKVAGSYGTLVNNEVRTADGLLSSRQYGDLAKTTQHYQYNTNRWLTQALTSRAGVKPELLLDASYSSYDLVGNAKQITDNRDAPQWPTGAKPVSRSLTYDDLYRLRSVNYSYKGGDDTQGPLFGPADLSPVPVTLPPDRVKQQLFDYDWQQNLVSSRDDANAFFSRSVGTEVYGSSSAGPNQVQSVSGPGGSAAIGYDVSGNMTSFVEPQVPQGDGSPVPSFQFNYTWDEVGRLSGAVRTDYSATSLTQTTTITYAYSASGQRVSREVQIAADGASAPVYFLEIFPSLRVNATTWNDATGDFDRDETTETAYLVANGVSYGRVVYDDTVPMQGTSALHVYLQLSDALGSTSSTIDLASSELVEQATYLAYGAGDSDYRPAAWHSFRESYRYTGKEDDYQVGLVYFGQRYLSTALGRWASADPLNIHGLGGEPNPYAFVQGSPLEFTDSVGYEDDNGAPAPDEPTPTTQDPTDSTSDEAPIPSSGAGQMEIQIKTDTPEQIQQLAILLEANAARETAEMAASERIQQTNATIAQLWYGSMAGGATAVNLTSAIEWYNPYASTPVAAQLLGVASSVGFAQQNPNFTANVNLVGGLVLNASPLGAVITIASPNASTLAKRIAIATLGIGGLGVVGRIAGAAAEGAEALSTRALTAVDLGLSGKGITNLAGDVVNAGTTRIISVGNIAATRGALLGELRGALPNILGAARAEGVQTLQISGSFAYSGLADFAASQAAQYGGTFSSAAGQETLTFILGAP